MTPFGVAALVFVVLVQTGREGAAPEIASPAPGCPFVELPSSGARFSGRFATSEVCALCHSTSPRATAMRDAAGRPISQFGLWCSSPMASSARDPIWQAVVSAEARSTPSRASEIGAKCLRCHAPMASGPGERSLAFLRSGSEAARVALDGVSCTVCHQILPDRLGTPESHSGGFAIGGSKEAFGPHEGPFAMPMMHHSGYTPVQGDHILRPELCATCHTLRTDALEPDGTPSGARFLEQSPWIEWRCSAYVSAADRRGADAATCQDCHLPTRNADATPIRTRIVRNPGGRDWPPTSPRSPYGRHVLVGGNTLLPRILAEHVRELGTAGSRAEFEETLAAARAQLRERTARVSVEGASVRDGILTAAIRVENLAGHKLPTGHPSRRAWLRVRIRDGGGAVLLASGEHDRAGRILGADGAPLPEEVAGGPFAPHRGAIDSSDRAAIWETVMEDARGGSTYLLLRAVRSRKDDRLLPRGWDPGAPEAFSVLPVGVEGDRDFAAGGDRVELRLALPADVARPLAIEADLLYQTLGARYLAEILRIDTPEVAALRAHLELLGNEPEILARCETRIP